MATNNHAKFSLIIPCFNESKNISLLFDEIAENQKNLEFEIIIVNNGSTDNSKKIINLNKYKLKNLKVINIQKNIGFGYGVKKGLLKAKSKIVCYTHGDLQVNIEKCLDAYKIFKESKKKNVFVKSLRKNRSFFDTIFTTLMSIFNTVIFRKHLFDIHAQPNLFWKPNNNVILSCPNDMSLDLFFYIFFKKKNYLIKRFEVSFNNRIYGVGSNELILNKFIYLFKSIINSFLIKKLIYKND